MVTCGEKLTTGAFWGWEWGWRAWALAQIMVKSLSEHEFFYLCKQLNIPKTMTIWSSRPSKYPAGALSLRSHSAALSPSPPFLFSKHKTKQGCKLAIDQEVGYQLCSAWHCDWNGRNAWKRISAETTCLGDGRSQLSFVSLQLGPSWFSEEEKDVLQRKDEFTETCLCWKPSENQKSLLEEWTKIESESSG